MATTTPENASTEYGEQIRGIAMAQVPDDTLELLSRTTDGDGTIATAPSTFISVEAKVVHDTTGAVAGVINLYGTHEASIPTSKGDYIASFVLSGTDEHRGNRTIEHAWTNLYADVSGISATTTATLVVGILT